MNFQLLRAQACHSTVNPNKIKTKRIQNENEGGRENRGMRARKRDRERERKREHEREREIEGNGEIEGEVQTNLPCHKDITLECGARRLEQGNE